MATAATDLSDGLTALDLRSVRQREERYARHHFDSCRSSDVTGSTPTLVTQSAVGLFPERWPGFGPGYSDRPGTVGAPLVG